MAKGVKNTMEWVIGISSIALIILILLVVFGNLSGNMGFADTTTKIAVSNETITWVNATGFTLSGYNSTWSGITGTTAFNSSDDTGFGIGNISISTTGVVKNATNTTWNGADSVLLSYTYTHTHNTQTENGAEAVVTNMSSGIGKMVTQVPTILLFVGIALLLAVLIGLLVFVINRFKGFGGNKTPTYE